MQPIRQELQTGCPKLAIVEFWGDNNIFRLQSYLYKLKIRHNILMQCYRNYIETKEVINMLEIDVLRYSS